MKVTYNGNVLTLPAGTTVEAAREVLKGIYPEIATATVKTTADGIEFVVHGEVPGLSVLSRIPCTGARGPGGEARPHGQECARSPLLTSRQAMQGAGKTPLGFGLRIDEYQR